MLKYDMKLLFYRWEMGPLPLFLGGRHHSLDREGPCSVNKIVICYILPRLLCQRGRQRLARELKILQCDNFLTFPEAVAAAAAAAAAAAGGREAKLFCLGRGM